MSPRDANHPLTVQRVSDTAHPAEQKQADQGCVSSSRRTNDWQSGRQEIPSSQLLGTPPSRIYPVISTERIMRAVEQQRRNSQELDALCARQKASAECLRKTSFKLMVGLSFLFGLLVLAFILLSIFQPDILVHLLNLLGDAIAVGILAGEGIKAAFSLIPSNSWLLSGVALVIVLMMGLWLRLMRHPREV